jgi:hypothetical protein
MLTRQEIDSSGSNSVFSGKFSDCDRLSVLIRAGSPSTTFFNRSPVAAKSLTEYYNEARSMQSTTIKSRYKDDFEEVEFLVCCVTSARLR